MDRQRDFFAGVEQLADVVLRPDLDLDDAELRIEEVGQGEEAAAAVRPFEAVAQAVEGGVGRCGETGQLLVVGFDENGGVEAGGVAPDQSGIAEDGHGCVSEDRPNHRDTEYTET